MTTINDQLEKIRPEPDLIAALDQIGASTPKALLNYGIDSEASREYKELVKSTLHSTDRVTGPVKTGPGFFKRLMNSVQSLPGSNRPAGETIAHDLQLALDNLAKSAQAIIKKPQLANRALDANIRMKNAEAMEREALARKISVESRILEQQLKNRESFDS